MEIANIFYSSLDKLEESGIKEFRNLKQKYINDFENSYQIISPNNNELMQIYYEICNKHNIISRPQDVFAYLKDFPQKEKQLSLF